MAMTDARGMWDMEGTEIDLMSKLVGQNTSEALGRKWQNKK